MERSVPVPVAPSAMPDSTSRIRAMLAPERILRGVLGVGAMQGVKLVATLVTATLLARAMGPEGYGVFMHVSAIIFVAAVPVSAGLPNLLMRETARYEHDGRWDLLAGLLRRAHQFVILASLLIALPVCLYSVYQAGHSSDPIWAVLAVAVWMIPLLGLSGLRMGLLKGLQLPIAGNAPEFFIRPLFYLVAVLGILWLGFADPRNAAWVQLASVAASFAAGILFLRRHRPAALNSAVAAFDMRNWVSTLLPFTLLAAVTTTYLQIGMVLVGWLADDADAGYFAVAVTIATVVYIPLQVASIVAAPQFARAHKQGDLARLQSVAQDAARLALVAALPAAAVFVLAGPWLIETAFGGQFAPAYWPMVILVAGQVLNILGGSVGQLLNMTGHERISTYTLIAALILNAVLCAALIPAYGALGAAIANAAAYAVLATVQVIAAKRFIGIRSTAL